MIQNFCKRKKQPNTLTVLWTAEIAKLSFPWICDISHKVSFPSRSSNCFCLLSFAFDSTKKGKHLWRPIWKHLLASNHTHWGTAETFLTFFVGWSQTVSRDSAVRELWRPFQMRLKQANRRDRHSGMCITQGLGELARRVPKTIPLVQHSMWVEC